MFEILVVFGVLARAVQKAKPTNNFFGPLAENTGLHKCPPPLRARDDTFLVNFVPFRRF